MLENLLNGEAVFKKILRIILVIAALALVVAGFSLYMDYLKINEVGTEYVAVFFTRLGAKLFFGGALFLLTLILFLANGALLRRTATARGELTWILKRKYLFGVGVIVSAFAALGCSSGMGEKFLLWKNAVDYGTEDPLFGKDISYFLLKRDFYISMADIFVMILVLLLIYTAVAYIAMYAFGGMDGSPVKVFRSRAVFGHCAVLVFLMGAVKALTYRFTSEGLVYAKTAGVTGAGYTDVKIRLPFYTAAPYIICVLLIVGLFFLFKGKIKPVIITVLVFPALLIIMSLVGAFTDNFIVAPKEVAMEEPYIESNIKYTKMGFKLDNIEERTFPVTENLTARDIANNSETIENIRITDLPSTLSVSNSSKSIRDYYTFTDSDIVPYTVNGQKSALNLAPRELDTEKLPETSKNYINLHLRYTHGYGIVASKINQVSEDGQPIYVIDNMPVTSAEGYPQITEPRIYYGEKTDNYVVVNTGYDELDYVTDDELTGKIYNGDSGIAMTGLNRFLFALDNLDYKLLISGYIDGGSRLLINRNIFKRVEMAAPFLIQDNDPYILVDENGGLKWVLDLYTTSDKMPYSQSYNGINYIRNSAKAVIDAYTGDVKIYITDPDDPIIRTYEKIYPSAFADGEFPADLREHIRCPEAMFSIQYNVFLRYHMTDTANFYGNSDLWATPKEKYMNNETTEIMPYYNLMQLKSFGDEDAELVLMQPFVPANKENLVGWLASRSNGEMMLYKFPTGKTVYGTLHIENRIDSNDEFSKEISLWDQGGSNVIKGNLLVIPIENSLLYVEPIYLTTSNNAALPEVKRVVVAYGEDVVMEPTLEDALNKLFGSAEGSAAEPPEEITPVQPQPPAGEVEEIAAAYEAVERAQTSGDWIEFGRAMEALKEAIYGNYSVSEAEVNE